MADAVSTLRIAAVDATRQAFASVSRNVDHLASRLGGLRSSLVGLGALAGIGALVSTFRNVTEAADHLNDLRQSLGVTVEGLSALQNVGKLSGVTLDDLEVSFKKLAKAADSGSDAFRRLNIDPTQFQSQEALFLAITQRLATLQDGYKKTAIALELFGKSGSKILPLANELAAASITNVEALRKQATVTDEAARAADQFNDNLARLAISAEKVGIAIVGKILGPLADLSEKAVTATKAGGFIGMWLGEASTGDAESKIQKTEARLKELLRLQDEMVKARETLAGRLSRFIPGISVEEDISILQLQIAGAKKELAYLKQVNKDVAEEAARRARPAAKRFDPGDAESKLAEDRKRTAEAARKQKAIDEELQKASELHAKTAVANLHLEAEAIRDDIAIRKERFQVFIDETKAQADFLNSMEDEAEVIRRQVNPIRELTEQYNRLAELQKAGFIDSEEAAKRAQQLRAQAAEIEGVQKATEKTNDVARDLGFTFSSAFEDAVLASTKLRDVISGLGQDLARITLRKSVTEPLAGAFSSALSGVFASFAVGTPFVPRDMLAMVHRGERIVPAAENKAGGAGGVTVNNYYTLSGNVSATDALRIIKLGDSSTKSSILESRRRGGQFS